MICIQDRLFDVSEMAISMKAFVQARLEGFGLRQAARADKRQREKRNADARGDTQQCFGFGFVEMTLGPIRAVR